MGNCQNDCEYALFDFQGPFHEVLVTLDEPAGFISVTRTLVLYAAMLTAVVFPDKDSRPDYILPIGRVFLVVDRHGTSSKLANGYPISAITKYNNEQG